MTVKDIIDQAMRINGVSAHGEPFLDPAATTEAYKSLNRTLQFLESPLILPEKPDLSCYLINLPPGYRQAMVYNLAAALAPVFGIQTSQVIEKMAYEARRAIRDLAAYGPDGYCPNQADYEALVLLREARATLVAQLELRRAA